MRHAIEVEELQGWGIFLRLCRILLELNLLDVHPDLVSVLRSDAIVVEQVDVAVPSKGFYKRVREGNTIWVSSDPGCLP